MQEQETWDQLYRSKRAEQRKLRGARVKHAQLRQEIADLAIAFIETPKLGEASDLYIQAESKVKELRTLEQQYPELKETT